METGLLILVMATAVVAAFWAAPRLLPRRLVFDAAPDAPRPFGPDMAWIAVRTQDTARVAEVLGLAGATPANWNSGIGTVYDASLSDRFVFVSPPADGWTYIAGETLPLTVGPGFVDKLTPLLDALAQVFGDVQYFATFPIIDHFAWARYDGGHLRRRFAIGDAGPVLNIGRLTADEIGLGLRMFDVRGISGRKGDAGGAILLHPTEEYVLQLAKAWGPSPLRLARRGLAPGLGLVATAPGQWRAQRQRRAA